MNSKSIVCQNCLCPNEVPRDFCKKCGAPTGPFTSTSPAETILSAGSAYRNASSNPTKPIVLIGIWLLFAPGAVLLFYALFKIIAQKAWSKDIAWFLCYGAISIALLGKTTASFIKNKSRIWEIKHDKETIDPEMDLDMLRDRQ